MSEWKDFIECLKQKELQEVSDNMLMETRFALREILDLIENELLYRFLKQEYENKLKKK